MNIFTLVWNVDNPQENLETIVLGSRTDPAAAQAALVDAIVDKIRSEPDLAYDVWHDENHEDLPNVLCAGGTLTDEQVARYFEDRDPAVPLPDAIVAPLKAYIAQWVGACNDGAYYVYCASSGNLHHFDIFANELEGL